MTHLEPIDRISFNAQQLVTEFPPSWLHPNKSTVYEISCPPGSVQNGEIGFTRWAAVQLPKQVDIAGAVKLATISPGFYDYVPVSTETSVTEWHVNFADPQLFGFYESGLFAQDEMQVAEHPALGSLRDAIPSNGANPVTEEQNEPTPVLVTGVERRVVVATDPNPVEERPYGLYGNNFSSASSEAIRRATKAITPPTVSNIIAMAAPGMGHGRYSIYQIEKIIVVATTGFTAAVSESERIHGAASKAIIHTGFWGCGAFGGNKMLMVMLQMVAAGMSGVSEIVFHAADPAGKTEVNRSIETLGDMATRSANADTEALVADIESMGFEWGVSDGN